MITLSHTRNFILETMLLAIVFLGMSSFVDLSGQTPGALIFDSLVVKEEIPLLEDSLSPVNNLSIHFVFPSQASGDPVLLSKIQNEFVKAAFGEEYAFMRPKEAIDSYLKKYKADYWATQRDYNKAKEEGFDMGDWGNSFQTIRISLVNTQSSILSFMISVDNSMGGAHGSHNMGYYNVNLKTGTLITEADIFKPGYESKLTEAIIDQLLEDNKLSERKKLIEKGYFNLKDLKPNRNFLILNDGIVYAFNEYEIAPYNMGVRKVLLSDTNTKFSSILKDPE